MKKFAAAAMVAVGIAAGSASALTITGGTVDGWGVTPFSGGPVAGVSSFDGNDTAPINYPHVGYVPSPGGSRGERFDLEEMHIRRNAGRVEMLVVASSGFTASAYGNSFNLGDVLIDVGGDGMFDYGLVSQGANAGLVAGGLYELAAPDAGLLGLQPGTGSYLGHSLESQIGPWAVGSGSLLGQIDVETAMYDYGGKEDGTWVLQFAFDEGLIDEMGLMSFHLVWGCGNDKLTGELGPTPPQTAVPEPVTAVLSLMGGMALVTATRRRRK